MTARAYASSACTAAQCTVFGKLVPLGDPQVRARHHLAATGRHADGPPLAEGGFGRCMGILPGIFTRGYATHPARS